MGRAYHVGDPFACWREYPRPQTPMLVSMAYIKKNSVAIATVTNTAPYKPGAVFWVAVFRVFRGQSVQPEDTTPAIHQNRVAYERWQRVFLNAWRFTRAAIAPTPQVKLSMFIGRATAPPAAAT